MANPQIFLASKSPRRRELLEQIGVRYAVIAAELDEIGLPGETAAHYVMRIALGKARAGRVLAAEFPDLPVLGADTAVIIDGHILGKPQDAGDAAAMMRLLSGRMHRVLSAVAVVGTRDRQALSISEVVFRTVTPREAQAYWETGEPVDKAGGYGIQGLGALFVSELRGSYSGVMGLPLYETAQLLAAEDIELLARTDQLKEPRE